MGSHSHLQRLDVTTSSFLSSVDPWGHWRCHVHWTAWQVCDFHQRWWTATRGLLIWEPCGAGHLSGSGAHSTAFLTARRQPPGRRPAAAGWGCRLDPRYTWHPKTCSSSVLMETTSSNWFSSNLHYLSSKNILKHFLSSYLLILFEVELPLCQIMQPRVR